MRLFKGGPVFFIETINQEIYLTFDDGPHPVITPAVLDILRKYNAKASFFCLGERIEQFPDLYRQIIDDGHVTGNHGYTHLNGYQTELRAYLRNYLKNSNLTESGIFRPPYGKITRAQYKLISKRSRIILWDVMPGDFDNISKEKCLRRSIKHSKRGSIIVLHENEKSKTNMIYTLHGTLDHFSGLGFKFKSLPIDLNSKT